MRLDVEFKLCCAHALPYYDGPCRHMHGHNYKLVVTLQGKPDPKSGMILDFDQLKRMVSELAVGVVDHKVLNDFMDNPTAENLIVWFWDRLHGKVPHLFELRLWETDEYSVSYRGV